MGKYGRQSGSKDASGLFAQINTPMLVGAIIVLGFILAALLYSPPKVDKTTGCAANPHTNLVVLVDLSDSLTKAQKASLVARFEYISSHANNENESASTSQFKTGFDISKGDKLTVYLLGESEQPRLIFSACSPGDETETNALTEGQVISRKKWQGFISGISNAIEAEFQNRSDLNRSFILESIAYVRAKEFPPSEKILDTSQLHKLVIVSNFLQNSGLQSHYNSEYKGVNVVHMEHPISLTGIDVYGLFLAHPDYVERQKPELLAWWRTYFSESVTGARMVDWRPL